MSAVLPPGCQLHAPGALSCSGVLDVGLKCAHSCRFCYYSFMSEAQGQHDALRHARREVLAPSSWNRLVEEAKGTVVRVWTRRALAAGGGSR